MNRFLSKKPQIASLYNEPVFTATPVLFASSIYIKFMRLLFNIRGCATDSITQNKFDTLQMQLDKYVRDLTTVSTLD